ncbi:Calcium-channel cch1 [Gossypium arboreum]|uniref:Calcium-channel cch1 n=1 Tax=Gossypium arboreum TaxID=29729 RepID=A0A0B0NIG3_GOSAR|nr:Calcium-channel cch1 [Gossypium arboreum]
MCANIPSTRDPLELASHVVQGSHGGSNLENSASISKHCSYFDCDEEDGSRLLRCAWRGRVIRGAWHEWKNWLEAAVAEAFRVSAENSIGVLGLGFCVSPGTNWVLQLPLFAHCRVTGIEQKLQIGPILPSFVEF